MFVADSRQKSQTFVLENDEIPASNGTVVRVVQIDETMRAAQCPLIEEVPDDQRRTDYPLLRTAVAVLDCWTIVTEATMSSLHQKAG